MSESTYFFQECPTCGRGLHIRVEYLGRAVVCQHCRGRFLAVDTQGAGPAPSESSLSLLRADELLSLLAENKVRPR